ncbi:MAG: toxic anion resistance protein [Clostridia bacterium]|nr:toxic anion resistance protein [Clostridia bacterium]
MEKENLVLEVKPEISTKEIENELIENKVVTEEKIEDSLNYDKLSTAEKEAIDNFLVKLDLTDTTNILSYGASAQQEIAKFSDDVLQNVRTKNAGDVGELLTDLVVEIKDFDSATNVNEPKGFFAMFTSLKKRVQKLLSKYDKVNNNIDKIEKRLENHKMQMLKDIAIFDEMYEKNMDSFKNISLYIIAGDKKIKELKEVELPKLQQLAQESGEQLDAQKVNDLMAVISRFEKKIYDLKTTRIISIQMAPQIRMIQNNDSELVEKIQSSIINTIPLWKNQVVIALGLANAKSALNTQQAVSEITNEMLKKNSENLKQGTIEIAAESEKAIVDVETLQKTNSDLIATLDALIQIHDEGTKKRSAAEIELQKIEHELKEKLLAVKNEQQQ